MIQLDSQDIRFLKARIKEYDGPHNLIEQIIKELDATLVLPDGFRPRQTNSYVWKRTDAEFHYLLNELMDNGITNEVYNEYITRYNNVLERNKEFELEHPPVVYAKKAKSSVKRVRVDKVNSMFDGDELKVGEKAVKTKVKKETIADRKRKALSNKAVTFAFGGLKSKE